MSYRRVLISIPAVRVGRDRFGQLLDTAKTKSRNKESRGINNNNRMLRIDDDEYGDPGSYLEYPSLEEAKEPLEFENLQVNDDNSDNDVIPNPQELEQAG